MHLLLLREPALGPFLSIPCQGAGRHASWRAWHHRSAARPGGRQPVPAIGLERCRVSMDGVGLRIVLAFDGVVLDVFFHFRAHRRGSLRHAGSGPPPWQDTSAAFAKAPDIAPVREALGRFTGSAGEIRLSIVTERRTWVFAAHYAPC